MNTTLNNIKGKLSPTAIANYFGGNRGSITEDVDDPQLIQSSQQSPLTQPDPEKTADSSKAKGGTKSRTTRTFDCPECTSKVKKLIECEFCRTWMCLPCADLSNEAYKIANEWQHTLHFYCKHCFPKVYNLIINYKSSPNVSESLEDLNNKIESLSQQLSQQLQDIPKISSLLNKTYSEVSRTTPHAPTSTTGTPKNPTPTINKQIEAVNIIDEFTEREKRKNNIVLSNIPEPVGENREARSANDLQTVKSIIDEYKIQGVNILKTVRLGKYNPQSTRGRLVLAELADNSVKGRLLSTASRKRQTSQLWNNVYISPDLTPQQRLEGKQLRDELKRRRENGEQNLIIRNNKIMKDPKAQITGTNPQSAATAAQSDHRPVPNTVKEAHTRVEPNTANTQAPASNPTQIHPLPTNDNSTRTTPAQLQSTVAAAQVPTKDTTQGPPLENTDNA